MRIPISIRDFFSYNETAWSQNSTFASKRITTTVVEIQSITIMKLKPLGHFTLQ